MQVKPFVCHTLPQCLFSIWKSQATKIMMAGLCDWLWQMLVLSTWWQQKDERRGGKKRRDGKLMKKPWSIQGCWAHDNISNKGTFLPSTAFYNTFILFYLYWRWWFGSTTVMKLRILKVCFCSPSSSMGIVRSSVLNWHGHWILVAKGTLIGDKQIVTLGC